MSLEVQEDHDIIDFLYCKTKVDHPVNGVGLFHKVEAPVDVIVDRPDQGFALAQLCDHCRDIPIPKMQGRHQPLEPPDYKKRYCINKDNRLNNADFRDRSSKSPIIEGIGYAEPLVVQADLINGNCSCRKDAVHGHIIAYPGGPHNSQITGNRSQADVNLFKYQAIFFAEPY